MEKTYQIKKRSVLDRIEPYKPGKPIWEVQEDLGLKRVIKLASNENPLGPSPKAIEAIMTNLNGINRYPDSHANQLKQSIAYQYGLSPSQLIITNGADELITLISETFLEASDEIIVPSPSFGEYDFGAHLMGAKIVKAPLDYNFSFSIENILSAITEYTKLIYICSPNNPTGTYMPKQGLEQLLQKLPKDILVVFDSAYSHYATNEDYTDGIEYVKDGFPIIILQTFSKIYGLAGLRIGFGVAPEAVIQDIQRVKEPFNVNTLAQTAAIAAINDEVHLKKSKHTNTIGRNMLYEGLTHLGVTYTESMSNFVLVDFGPDAKQIYEKLLAKGIIVRYGDTWGMSKYIRFSVGTYEENIQLLLALKLILGNRSDDDE
ncbi:histidinol-phosphate transaminase [Bacillus sp. HNG]|uniref:histidinol-phosphate transaminase n=1 Tax=Bacillus sp. HNG TaxID=2293325 RepID=UPI001CB9A9B8|nr:histidinol-phosphate transaminase [Bacillus sp. HNG]